MSLPPAQKDISAHPAAGSMTAPVDKLKKDEDVDRKLRFYGVIEAFRHGRLPSNEQVDKTMRYVLDHSPVHIERLSPEGRKLINDMRHIIETARLMVLQKNTDELFQYFVWHTQEVDREKLPSGDISEKAPTSSEKVKEDSQEAIRHLRTLLHLILTNSEIRKLLSDFSIIGRDLLAIGVHKLADTIAPQEEALRHVDDPGPEGKFISENGRQIGHDGTERPAQDVRREAGKKVDESRTEVPVQAAELKQPIDGQAQAGNSEEAERRRQGILGKMKDVRDNFLDRIPTEHKDKVQDHAERGKKFLTEEYFPEERREQFIFRGKKVIIECQKHDDYQESIKWLIGLFEEYAKHGRATGAAGSKGAFIKDPNLKRAIDELRTLLERFANNTSLSIVIDAVDDLIDDSNHDERLRSWFQQVDSYLRKVLLEPGYILEEESNKEAERLRVAGREFYEGKYKSHMDNLFNSISAWFKAMGEDPLNHRFGEDWARLMKDLLFDSEGSLTFKTQLWSDIRKVILPEIVDKVGYIPIPRIEYTDDSLDLVVENLTLSGRNLFPNIISIEAHNFLKFSPYDAIQDVSHHTFKFTLDQMQADMRDVAFFYRKKTGIPKMSDSGIADVILGGNGLHATVTLSSANSKDKSSVFRVQEVHVKVETLKFSIRDSKHDFLYKTLRPLATALVKRQLQKVFADALRTLFEYVDGQLVTVRDRMEEAKASKEHSRTEVLKELFTRKGSGEESVTESQSHFKVVANKRNSILAHEGHPAGWVNRMAEKESAAERGSEWRSDAFNIV